MMNTKGMTLIEILVGTAIIAVLALSMTSLVISNHSTVASDLRGDGARRVNAAAGELMRESGFVSIVVECKRVGALEATASLATCLDGSGAVNANIAVSASPYPLQKLVDSFGAPSTTGDYCTEISRCHMLAGGRLVQVDYVTYFNDRVQSSGARSIVHMIRVTR